MSICIATLQYTNNYGAVLQAYALQKYLQDAGHVVAILNYEALRTHPLPWYRGWGLKSGLSKNAINSKLLRIFYSARTIDKFNTFRRRWLNLTNKCHTENEACKLLLQYDLVIFGSDQIWNQKWFHPIYYGGNCKLPNSTRFVSYAASAGYGLLSHDRIIQVKHWLSNFSAVGVRDRHTQHILDSQLNISSSLNCDPTLLCDLSSIEERVLFPAQPYILAFILHPHSNALAKTFILLSRSNFSLPVYAITLSAHEAFKPPLADKYINNASPSEWHYLFRNASFVLTDSFHGSMFSLKFNKPFVCLASDELTAMRIQDAARRFHFVESIATPASDHQSTIKQALNRDIHLSTAAIDANVKESRRFINQVTNQVPF
jgi:hypothetical protein